ncbi:MAG: hypothetical protein LH472_02305 [Pyrinomonadaceae bacterium]|nr:hypothetical protein [Pyrinomonadaceae bacterium]
MNIPFSGNATAKDTDDGKTANAETDVENLFNIVKIILRIIVKNTLQLRAK